MSGGNVYQLLHPFALWQLLDSGSYPGAFESRKADQCRFHQEKEAGHR